MTTGCMRSQSAWHGTPHLASGMPPSRSWITASAEAASAPALPLQALKALHKPQSHSPEGEGNCLGFATLDSQGVLVPHRFQRRPGGCTINQVHRKW